MGAGTISSTGPSPASAAPDSREAAPSASRKQCATGSARGPGLRHRAYVRPGASPDRARHSRRKTGQGLPAPVTARRAPMRLTRREEQSTLEPVAQVSVELVPALVEPVPAARIEDECFGFRARA